MEARWSHGGQCHRPLLKGYCRLGIGLTKRLGLQVVAERKIGRRNGLVQDVLCLYPWDPVRVADGQKKAENLLAIGPVDAGSCEFGDVAIKQGNMRGNGTGGGGIVELREFVLDLLAAVDTVTRVTSNDEIVDGMGDVASSGYERIVLWLERLNDHVGRFACGAEPSDESWTRLRDFHWRLWWSRQ